MEIAHAYLRPRMGLTEIPILLLYERNYWVNGLTTMVRGLSPDEMPNVSLVEYSSLSELENEVRSFLNLLPT